MQCSACNATLAAPDAPCSACGASPHTAFVKVFETGEPALLAIVRAKLDDAEIPNFVEGEGALGMLPLGSFGRSFFGRAVSAVIRVPADVAEEAKAVIEATGDVDEVGDDEVGNDDSASRIEPGS